MTNSGTREARALEDDGPADDQSRTSWSSGRSKAWLNPVLSRRSVIGARGAEQALFSSAPRAFDRRCRGGTPRPSPTRRVPRRSRDSVAPWRTKAVTWSSWALSSSTGPAGRGRNDRCGASSRRARPAQVGAEGLEGHSRGAEMLGRLVRPARPPQALPEAQLGARTLERGRGAIVQGKSFAERLIGRSRQREHPATARGFRLYPDPAARRRLCLELFQGIDRVDSPVGPNIGLDQVRCGLNDHRAEERLGDHDSRLEFGDTRSGRSSESFEEARADVAYAAARLAGGGQFRPRWSESRDALSRPRAASIRASVVSAELSTNADPGPVSDSRTASAEWASAAVQRPIRNSRPPSVSRVKASIGHEFRRAISDEPSREARTRSPYSSAHMSATAGAQRLCARNRVDGPSARVEILRRRGLLPAGFRRRSRTARWMDRGPRASVGPAGMGSHGGGVSRAPIGSRRRSTPRSLRWQGRGPPDPVVLGHRQCFGDERLVGSYAPPPGAPVVHRGSYPGIS